jgi:coenzyme F420-reducing hydrogenase gamma subunit
VLADPDELAGPLDAILPVDLRIPGCPPTPAQIADALTDALDVLRRKAMQPSRAQASASGNATRPAPEPASGTRDDARSATRARPGDEDQRD